MWFVAAHPAWTNSLTCWRIRHYASKLQTCQGPEMKMRETVRHSGKGAIFSGEGALPVMRPLSKFTDSCLHSCCRTEEIKFSIKPITRKPIQNLWLFYQIKYKTLSIRRTHVYSNFSPQKENTYDIKNIVFRWAGKCVRFPLCGVRAWDSSKMRESHARCVRLGRSAYHFREKSVLRAKVSRMVSVGVRLSVRSGLVVTCFARR